MLQLKNVYKTYKTKKGVSHRALNNVSLTLPDKGLVFVVGKSGSGKSTLLNVLAGIDKADRGELIVDGLSTKNFTEKDFDYYRNSYVGIVFQAFNLIPELNAFQNVTLSLGLQGEPNNDEAVAKALETVGIADLSHKKPNEISGGQRQRLAIARAIVKKTPVILADEPTGSLDSATGKEIFDLLKSLAEEKLVLVVSHNREVADEIADRVIEISDGEIIKDIKRGETLDETTVNSDLLGTSILRLKKPVMSQNDVAVLDEITSSSTATSYINVTQDEQKIKSMFPRYYEAITDKKRGGYISTGNEENAKAQRTYQSKKSSLPIKFGAKLGFANLNYKKIRLCFAVLLTVLTLVLFTAARSVNNFDLVTSFAHTLKNENITNVELTKVNSGVYLAEDYAKIDEIIGDATVIKTEDHEEAPEPTATSKKQVYTDMFSTFRGYILANPAELGYEFAFGGFEQNKVCITDFAAKYLIKYNYFEDVEEISALVGKELKTDYATYIISGIVKTDSEKYDVLENADYWDYSELQISFDSEYEGLLARIFISESLASSILSELSSIKLDVKIISHSENYGVEIVKKSFAQAQLDDDVFLYCTGNDDGFWVSSAMLRIDQAPAAAQTALENANALSNGAIFRKNTDDIHSEIRAEYAIGQTASIKFDRVFKSNIYMLVVPDELYEELLGNYSNTTKVIVKSDFSNYNNNYEILKKLGKTFSITGKYATAYSEYSQTVSFGVDILNTIAKYSAIVVVVLIYSYMRSTVKAKQRQIGILRAVGAKKIDTLKVFAWEGVIMGGISVVLSCLLSSLLVSVINNSISADFGMNLVVATFTANEALISALICFVVIALGSLLPLYKLMRKTPVEIISENN